MSKYPLDPDSIFGKIILGQIPAAKVLETEDAVAFLDINPVNLGHVLLVPKGSFATLMDLPDDLASATAALLPRLCRAVRAATGAEGINVLINNGRVAGQVIDHVHFHIIPRFAADAVRWNWPNQKYQDEGMAEMRERIARAISDPSPG